MYKMNPIERMFYDAFCDVLQIDGFDDKRLNDVWGIWQAEYQYPIDKYRVDFFFETFPAKFAVEIDGHDYHSSKWQRMRDYERERYLQVMYGIIFIRYTGTDVYKDAHECAREAHYIISEAYLRENVFWGYYHG